MPSLQQIITTLTALVMTLSSQVGDLSQSLNSQTQLAQVAPTSGLVGYWKFDEGSGATAADSSGNGNNGTLINGPTWTTGKVGGALGFDGVNDYVVNTSVVNTGVITVSAWVNIQSYPTNNFDFLVGFVNGLGSSINDKILRINTTGQADFYVYDGGGTGKNTSTSNPLTLNTWYHIVGVADGTNAYIYVNGVQAGSVAAGSTYTGYTLPNIFIGGGGGSNAPEDPNAKIDEVRIYNRALSASEISDIYNDTGSVTPPPPPPPTPVNGSCSTTLNSCSSGTFTDVTDTSSNYLWQCNGSNGGTTASCSLPIPPPPPADTTSPSIPTNLTATAISSSQINLSWTASTDNVAVTGYDVYRNGTLFTSVTGTSYSNTGLTASIQYSYTVRSKDAAGNTSSQSSSASATTQASSSGSRTFYIASNGSDSNNGTSKSTPWLHAPGMPACSGICASVIPTAGDRFILRGGDTWHFGNSGTSPYVGIQTISGQNYGWVWGPGWNGTTNNKIYIGVDQTWFNSSMCGSSWCRPIMNGDNPVAVSPVANCAYDQSNFVFFAMITRTHITLDNLEFTGMCWKNLVRANYINWQANTVNPGNLISNVYMHGWSHVTFNCGAGICDGANGLSGTTDQNFGLGDVVSNFVCDGSDSDPRSFICLWGDGYDVHNSVFRNTSNGAIVNNMHVWHDNLTERINASSDGATHPNGFEFNVENKGTNAIYNNVVRFVDNLNGVVTANTCPYSLDYMFNNILYGLTGSGNNWNIQSGTCGVASATSHVFNNTWVLQTGAAVTGPPVGSTVNFYNNHCILPNGGTQTDCSSYQGTENYATNLVQSTAWATSQGYTPSQTYVYSPTTGTNTTVGTGTNLQSYCTALANAGLSDAASACSSGTGYACTYNTATHSVSCPARTAISRPASGAWDVGAYQYSSTPPPPTYAVGDFNQDGLVNSIDFSLLSSKWLQSYSPYDLQPDGLINSLDYAIMSSNWTI